jgi:hypothetical protein
MTTLVLTNTLYFGPRPKGESARMSYASLETPEEAPDGIGGMRDAPTGMHPREDVAPDERAPHAPDHHHHRPHARETDHHHRPHEREPLPDHPHHAVAASHKGAGATPGVGGQRPARGAAGQRLAMAKESRCPGRRLNMVSPILSGTCSRSFAGVLAV